VRVVRHRLVPPPGSPAGSGTTSGRRCI
jgi:hypothetical protein